MKSFFISIKIKCRALNRSIKQRNEIHLGDDVIYKGKKCFVNNGTSYPKWDLLEEKCNEDGTRKHYLVHESDFKKIHNFHNLKNDLLSHYRWWKKYWYRIELENYEKKEN